MDDLISRQAAIDAISEYGSIWMEYTDSMSKEEIAKEALNSAKEAMISICKALPSAQPEIIRCGQCKYAQVADKEDAQDGYTCQFHRGSIWFSGSYCSWAERKTNG